MALTIYTDGGNSGKGGGVGGCSAIVLVDGKLVVELSEGYSNRPTNNKMELAGVLLGLYYVVDHPELGTAVTVVSDSEYVVKGASKWLAKWKVNNWKTTTGPVKNYPLWQAVDELNQLLTINWTWVRGHTGDQWNERADELATTAYTKIIEASQLTVG